MSAIASGRRAASALGFGRGAYSWLPRRFSSQIVKSVETVALARRLEAQGLPSNQAEAITATFTELLNDSLENISNSLLKPESEMTQDSNLSKFKSEVKSSQHESLNEAHEHPMEEPFLLFLFPQQEAGAHACSHTARMSPEFEGHEI